MRAVAGEPVVRVEVERELAWWQPFANALRSGPHGFVAGVLSVASIPVAVMIGAVVAVTGRVPRRLVAFQVLTVRERVRAYSLLFSLRTSHPPFSFALSLADPGDDPASHVALPSVPALGRGALVRHVARVVPHLVVLVPIGVVMDVCLPVWLTLAAVNRGWPEPFVRFLVAVERWVAHLALYALLATDVPPAFGLAANGYVPVGRTSIA